jgi:hypothetical protein
MGFPAELDYMEDQVISASNPTGKRANVNLEISRPFGQRNIVGLTPMLLLADGMPSGLPIQISKNWHEPGNIHWSSFTTTFELPANTNTELRLRIVYAQYGGVPAASHAQLSLVGWGGGGGVWHESALGSFGEAVCYEPNGQQRRGITTDVRPSQVCNMDSDGQTCKKYAWTENVGGGDFMIYFNSTGSYQYLKQQQNVWPGGVGPCLTNVSYNGISADGAITQEAGVSLGRTDRYNKQFHSIKIKVVKATGASRLAFYSLGTEGYNENYFAGITFGNGSVVEQYISGSTLDTLPGNVGYVGGNNRRACGKLNSDGSYASGSCWAFMPSSNVAPAGYRGGAGADRGLVVRKWRAVLGGQPVAIPHLSLFKTKADKAVLELSPPPGVTALMEGDFVEALVESIVQPKQASDYWGSDSDLKTSLSTLDAEASKIEATVSASTVSASWYTARLHTHWQLTALEAISNSPTATATEGSIESAHPVRVRVDATTNRAAFRLSSGLGYVPFTFTGLTSNCVPTLLTKTTQAANYVPVNQSVAGPYRCRCIGATEPIGTPDDPYQWVTHPFPSGSLPCASEARRCQGKTEWITHSNNAKGGWNTQNPWGNDFYQTDFSIDSKEFSITLNVPVASFGNWAVGAQLVPPQSNQGMSLSEIEYKFSCGEPDHMETQAPVLTTQAPTQAPTPTTSSPTPAVRRTAPPTRANAVSQAPTPAPTVVSVEEKTTLIKGASCLSQCRSSAPAAATKCEFLSYTLNTCSEFSSCTAAEARTVKDKCLGMRACSRSQCGVPATVTLVETPKAAVTVAMPMTGLTVQDLTTNLNLRLALRTGVATSLSVLVSDVSIKAMSNSTARRLNEGVTVEFEIAIADADDGAVAEMEEKVDVQADTFEGFVQASAADLGVLADVASLSIESTAVTATQATVESLPLDFVATATGEVAFSSISHLNDGDFTGLFTAYCPLSYYLISHGGECAKCPDGHTSLGGTSTVCHALTTEWTLCTHVSCTAETQQHCSRYQSANPALELDLAAVNKTGCTGRHAGKARLSVFHHGSELSGTMHRCTFTGTRNTPAAERECVCMCKDVA